MQRQFPQLLAILFMMVLGLSACGRQTPTMPVSDTEEVAAYEELALMYNTRSVNIIPTSPEAVDYNRTKNRRYVSDFKSKELRLQMVGRRVLAATYPLCPEEFRSRSMMVGIKPQSMTSPMVLWAITPFGQEDKTTLNIGDIILGIGNDDIGSGISESHRVQKILADAANRFEPLKFRVDRDGEILRVTQQPMNFCNYTLRLVRSNQVNAFADDKNVIVNTASLDVMPTDDELAALIGHEVAHNIMRHIPQAQWLIVIDYMFSVLTGLGQYSEDDGISNLTMKGFSRQHEYEADYVGVYLSALAGYDPEGAISLPRIFATYDPDYISDSDQWSDKSTLFHTHPEHAHRLSQFRKAIDQIKLKQQSGLPVLPEFLY